LLAWMLADAIVSLDNMNDAEKYSGWQSENK
jgi:hypothetical protein